MKGIFFLIQYFLAPPIKVAKISIILPEISLDPLSDFENLICEPKEERKKRKSRSGFYDPGKTFFLALDPVVLITSSKNFFPLS